MVFSFSPLTTRLLVVSAFRGCGLRVDAFRAGGGGGGDDLGVCSCAPTCRDTGVPDDVGSASVNGLADVAREVDEADVRDTVTGRLDGGGAGTSLFLVLSDRDRCESTDDRGCGSSSCASTAFDADSCLLSARAWPRLGGGAGVGFFPDAGIGSGLCSGSSCSGNLAAASRAIVSSVSSATRCRGAGGTGLSTSDGDLGLGEARDDVEDDGCAPETSSICCGLIDLPCRELGGGGGRRGPGGTGVPRCDVGVVDRTSSCPASFNLSTEIAAGALSFCNGAVGGTVASDLDCPVSSSL